MEAEQTSNQSPRSARQGLRLGTKENQQSERAKGFALLIRLLLCIHQGVDGRQTLSIHSEEVDRFCTASGNLLMNANQDNVGDQQDGTQY